MRQRNFPINLNNYFPIYIHKNNGITQNNSIFKHNFSFVKCMWKSRWEMRKIYENKNLNSTDEKNHFKIEFKKNYTKYNLHTITRLSHLNKRPLQRQQQRRRRNQMNAVNNFIQLLCTQSWLLTVIITYNKNVKWLNLFLNAQSNNVANNVNKILSVLFLFFMFYFFFLYFRLVFIVVGSFEHSFRVVDVCEKDHYKFRYSDSQRNNQIWLCLYKYIIILNTQTQMYSGKKEKNMITITSL